MIGIIVAMDSELKLLLAEMSDISTSEAEGYTFHDGLVGEQQVVAMKCGIGKVNAAVGALTLINRFHPDLVINTGIAGGTGAGAEVLSVVLANEVAYHDVWCGPGTEPGYVQGHPARYRCAIERFDLPALTERHPELMAGLIASGDTFVSTPRQLREVLRVQPEALAVDMESGAIAQVCYLKGVPFVAVRVVSDTPGVENHCEQYADFFAIAPQRTFAVLRSLLA